MFLGPLTAPKQNASSPSGTTFFILIFRLSHRATDPAIKLAAASGTVGFQAKVSSPLEEILGFYVLIVLIQL